MRRPAFRHHRWQRYALVAVALGAIGASHARMDVSTPIARGDDHLVPRPEHARFATFGFDSVVADYYWMLAVQVVGSEFGDMTPHIPLLRRLIDVVTTLDPWVDHPYRFAGLWFHDSVESIEHANRILERGIAYHPEDWRNRHLLGFNLFFYLEDDARAADVLEAALHLEGVPHYLGALVARLRSGHAGLGMAAALLRELARTTEDGFARAGYEKALDEIETERRARQLDAARLRYWHRHGRDIDAVGDLLVGPAPVLRALPPAHPIHPGFDWILDPDSGQIVSSFYRSRYRLHSHPLDDAQRARLREEREAAGERS